MSSLTAEPRPAQTKLWPKQRPTLTDEQQSIMNDWYAFWLPTLASRYGAVSRFNHEYAAKSAAPGQRTLEIGAGTGEHLVHEPACSDYYALELREELAETLRQRFPAARTIIGDCQQRIDVKDYFFDRVLAIHVLEHLPDLPSALDEVVRVLKPGGIFSVLIPCEGGFGYKIGREFTSKRMFEARYHTDYEWMITYDHINKANEILELLNARFEKRDQTFFPLRIPSVDLNLTIGLTLTPR